MSACRVMHASFNISNCLSVHERHPRRPCALGAGDRDTEQAHDEHRVRGSKHEIRDGEQHGKPETDAAESIQETAPEVQKTRGHSLGLRRLGGVVHAWFRKAEPL